MAGGLPISGQIDPQAFPFLLMDLHRSGATGSLKVEGPSYQKALYFRGGRVLFGSSNDPRDQLGAILIETGTLTPEQLEEANSKVGPGSPLAKVLSETGFVSQRELGEAARAKVERILSDVISYTAGSFEFEDGVLPKGAVDLRLSTERLLLAAVRRVSDRGFVLRHLEGLDVVLLPVAAMKGTLPEVEAEASELLGRLDGRRTLKEAAASTRLDEFEAAKLACTLLFLGLVKRAQDAPKAAETPAPLILPDEEPAEIDLSATAREAMTAAPRAAAAPTPPPAAPVRRDTAPVARSPEEVGAPMLVPDEERTVAPAEPPVVTPTGPPSPPAVAPSARAATVAPPAPSPSTAVPAPPLPAVPPPTAAPPAVAPAFSAPVPMPPPAPRVVTPAPALPLIPPPPRGQPMEAPFVAGPELTIPPAPSGVGPSKREAREWKPPGRSGPSASPARPALPPGLDELPRPPPSRPSKDDLAALDALLNSKAAEGPIAPLERTPQRFSPQFGAGPKAAARPRASDGSRSRVLAGGMALLLAGGATAALWYHFGQADPGANTAGPTAAGSGSTAEATGNAGSAVLAQGTRPASLPSTSASVAPVVRPSAAPATLPPVSRPSSVPTSAPPPPPGGAATAGRPATAGPSGLRDARALMERGRLPDAARSFAANLKAAPAGTFSVQLLVACSPDTVQKAVANASSAELYILPVSYRGRECFRLCWGLYTSDTQAASALRALPDYFRQGGATPRVMRAAELLP